MTAIPPEVREEIEKLERKHAANPEGRFFVPLANAYRKAGEVQRAMALLRDGIGRHPDYVSAHIVLGRCFTDQGDTAAAEAEFERVLSLDPQNLIALRTLGELSLGAGRAEDAQRWYRDLLAVDPMNEEARRALETLQEVGSASDAPPVAPAPWELVPPAADPDPDLPTLEPDPASAFDPSYGFGAMIDLDAGPGDPDAGASYGEGSGAVVTETIAELYTRQGVYDRAADVYRELIRRRGGDAALESRLAEVEALARGGGEEAPPPIDPPEAHELDEEFTRLDDYAMQRAEAFDPEPDATAELVLEGGPEEDALPGTFGAQDPPEVRDPAAATPGWPEEADAFAASFLEGFPLETAEDVPEEPLPLLGAEPTAADADGARPTIRSYLHDLLDWAPGAGAVPFRAEAEGAGFLDAGTPDPAAELPVPEAAAPAAETPHAEAWWDDDRAGVIDAPPPERSAAAGWGNVPADSGDDDLFPWEMPFDDAEAVAAEPGNEAGEGVEWRSAQPEEGGESEGWRSAGTAAAEAEPTEAFPPPPPAPAADGEVEPAPAEEPASTPVEEDDDLESFQAWLRSLKR